MKRYRVEFFNRLIEFQSEHPVSRTTLIYDYISNEKSSITIPFKPKLQKGWFARVKENQKVIYQGIIVDFTYNKSTTTIYFLQMLSLLDSDVFISNDVNIKNIAYETWMKEQIQSLYAGTDPFQKLGTIRFVSSTSTKGTIDINDDSIYNLYNLAVRFFKLYNAFIEFDISPNGKELIIEFKVVDISTVKQVNLNIDDVMDYSLSKITSTNKPNKITYVNMNDKTQTRTYYWHPEGFSGYVNTIASVDRVEPVVFKTKSITPNEGSDFILDSYNDALQTMYSNRYDDQLELLFNSKSKLVPVGKIGDLYLLHGEEEDYYTILTGIQYANDAQVMLTFGTARNRMTQVIKDLVRKENTK